MTEINMTNGKNIVGNYRIISELDRGSFGRVYLAQHSVLTSRVVALKLMHSVPLSSDQECNQFLQEARFLELLHYDYILPILDVGIHQGMPYIVSEYASGGSLRTRLKHRDLQPLAEEELLRILSQIGEALQYAHLKNIIHRDLKPENILFNAKGDALLADFGLATMLATASIKYLSNAGTPRYMSPEQFQGIVSKESDQYALGCIAYELWTGQPLFNASDPVSLMYKHVYEAPVPLTKLNVNVPSHVEQAILRALEKQRHDRHADVKAFITALHYPTSLQQVPEPIAQHHNIDSDQAMLSTISIPDSATKGRELEDEEQITTIKGASFEEERTRTQSTRLLTPFTKAPGNVSSLKEALPQGVYPLPALPTVNIEMSSSQGVVIPPVPIPHILGNQPSQVTPALPTITPFPTLPISRTHHNVRRWLIVAFVCLLVMASGIGGLLIIFPSFHSPTSDKGKTSLTSARLEVQNNTLDFGTLQVGVKVIQPVLITNTGGQPLDWEADTGETTWLSVRTQSGTILSGGLPQIIYTTANTDNLTPGTYSASVHIHSNAGDTQIAVELKVIPFSGTKQAKLSVNPRTLNFGNLAVGQQTTSIITVGNTGMLGLNWTADTGNTRWLSASPGSGTILPGGIPQTLTIVANTTNLTAGNYSAAINIHSNGGNSQVNIMLVVSSARTTQNPVTQPPGPTLVPPQINVNPQNMSFNNVPINTTKSQQLTITNGGGQSLNWSANTNVSWISLDKYSGMVNQGTSQSINLTVNTQGLSGGQTYPGTVSFTSNGGSFNLSVSLTTVANPAVLSVDQSSIDANNDCSWVPGSGHGIWTCYLTLRNAQNASSNLSWTASSSGFGSANMTANFSPSSSSISPGGSTSVTLTILTGSSQSSCWSSYSATLTFTGPNTVSVPWSCTAPYYVASPTNLDGGAGCQHTQGNPWVCTVTLIQQSQGYTNFSGQQTGNGASATFNPCCGETFGPGQSVSITVTITVSGSCPASITLVFLSIPNVNVPWSCATGNNVNVLSFGSVMLVTQDRWKREI
jgi:serine/threonine protein kinase